MLYNYQSSFRVNHSTNLSLSFFTDKILKGFDEGLLTGMNLINLQKAFYTIDNEILLQKLKAIRFSKGTLLYSILKACSQIWEKLLVGYQNSLS